jgi:hypothetical protein
MGVRDRILNALGGVPATMVAPLQETARQNGDTVELLQERLAELELALEDQGWRQLGGAHQAHEFSRQGLRTMTRLARLYWLKNPLIKRAVEIQQTYVFGQGINVQARDKRVNAVLQAFMADPKNQAELTSHQALEAKEAELQVTGNLFFCFFVSPAKGAVRVRSIPFDEVDDTIANPDDRKDVWFYVRKFCPVGLDGQAGAEVTELHPDWRYRPAAKPATVNGHVVRWDAPVYHVAVNRLADMKFGVSEVYAAIDWAKAYKQFLEDWATITRAYARFAWNVTTPGGKAGVAAMKAKLGTTLSTDSLDKNPPPAAGAAAIGTGQQKIEPIKTAGATTSAEDGRHLKLMVCAALGIYEHYFGDPSTGNLATATSMERPMELKFLSRRKLWADVLMAILDFVIDQAVIAPGGKLDGHVELDDYDEPRVMLAPDPDDEDAGDEGDRHMDVDFPALLEHDILARIEAIVMATTLDGKAPAGTLDLPLFTRMALRELGEDDVDAMIAQLFPEGWEEDRAAAAAERAAAAAQAMADQAKGNDTVKEAAVVLREAIIQMHGQLQELREAIDARAA